MLPRRLLLTLMALALTTAFAGCAAGPKEPATKSGTIAVSLKDSMFDPSSVRIKAGSTIAWTNHDAFAHDVTAGDKSWQSEGGDGGLDPNGMFSKTFDQAGTYEYYCTVHSPGPGSGMSGKIVVVA